MTQSDDPRSPTPQQERVERVEREEDRTYQESGRRGPEPAAPDASPRRPTGGEPEGPSRP